MTRQFDSIVIGAGLNGLCAAIRLAQTNQSVALIERDTHAGGRLAPRPLSGKFAGALLPTPYHIDDHVVDTLDLTTLAKARRETSATVLFASRTQPPRVLHRGALLADQPIADSYARFEAFLSAARPLVQTVARQPPPDLFSRNIADIAALLKNLLSLRSAAAGHLPALVRALPMPLADLVTEYIEDPSTAAGVALPALTATPFGPRAPGTASNLLIQHNLSSRPLILPHREVIDALMRKAERAGVTVLLDHEVATLNLDPSGAVTGVSLADDTALPTDCVLATQHPQDVLLDLASPAAIGPDLARDIEAYRTTGCLGVVQLVLGRPISAPAPIDLVPDELRVADDLDTLERAADALKYDRFPDQPPFRAWQTAADGSPPRPDEPTILTAHVFGVPYEPVDLDLESVRERLRAAVLDALRVFSPAVEGTIEEARVLTPADLEGDYQLPGGHLYGGDHSLEQRLLRPAGACLHYRTPIPGLYLGGSGSHPGGETTGLPGLLAAQTILRK